MSRVVLILEDVPGGHVHLACEWDAETDPPTQAQELAAAVFVYLEKLGATAKPEA